MIWINEMSDKYHFVAVCYQYNKYQLLL